MSRKFTAQDVIEVHNGDQVGVEQLIADALNSGEDLNSLYKKVILKMERDADELAQQESIFMYGTEKERRAYESKCAVLLN